MSMVRRYRRGPPTSIISDSRETCVRLTLNKRDTHSAMATLDELLQRQSPPQERAYRTPPHNLEAEQALLGAILINNDAFDRVSDFLRSEHFVEEIHRRIFEVAGSLIRAGKLATPVTLKTFLGEHDLGGVTVPQYLARLASEATTIINAYDYGRSVYDLAMRRELISIGEDVVNVAFDAPVNSSPATRSRKRSGAFTRSQKQDDMTAASGAFPRR